MRLLRGFLVKKITSNPKSIIYLDKF